MEDLYNPLFGQSEYINNIYRDYFPKEFIPKVKVRHNPDSEDAKAKGLHLYEFGDGNTLYARNDNEAIKRARKRDLMSNPLKEWIDLISL